MQRADPGGDGCPRNDVVPSCAGGVPKLERTAMVNRHSSQGQFTGLDVLLVEDESVVAEGIAMLLEMEGASVTTVECASETLSLVDSGRIPDLFIIDPGLPDASGGQLHEQLRARLHQTPIVISSGYGDPELIELLLRDCRTRFLQKPYAMSALYQTIRELLTMRESR